MAFSTPFFKLKVCSFTNPSYLSLYPTSMAAYADTKYGKSWGISLKRGCHGYLPGSGTGNIGAACTPIRSPRFSTCTDVTYVLKETLPLPHQAPVLLPKENHDEWSMTRT